MLHVETIEPNTLSILIELLKIRTVKRFSLVVGTALSLLFGHRKAIDLDLFSDGNFENDQIIYETVRQFGKLVDIRTNTPQFGIFCFIDNHYCPTKNVKGGV